MSSVESITILVVGAHPSDAIADVGGTIANHTKRGDNVIVLALTYGIDVHTEGLVGRSIEEIKQAQIEASTEAGKILGVSEYKYFDFGDVPLVSTREKLLELGEFIQGLRPDMIIGAHYPHHQTQGGDDHGEAARMLERAPVSRHHHGLEPFSAKATWVCSEYAYGLDHPSDGMPTVFVDIADTLDLKLRALRATWKYAGLEDDFEEVMKVAQGNLGLNGGIKYAEVFEGSSSKPTVIEHLSV